MSKIVRTYSFEEIGEMIYEHFRQNDFNTAKVVNGKINIQCTAKLMRDGDITSLVAIIRDHNK